MSVELPGSMMRSVPYSLRIVEEYDSLSMTPGVNGDLVVVFDAGKPTHPFSQRKVVMVAADQMNDTVQAVTDGFNGALAEAEVSQMPDDITGWTRLFQFRIICSFICPTDVKGR